MIEMGEKLYQVGDPEVSSIAGKEVIRFVETEKYKEVSSFIDDS